MRRKRFSVDNSYYTGFLQETDVKFFDVSYKYVDIYEDQFFVARKLIYDVQHEVKIILPHIYKPKYSCFCAATD